MTRRKKKSISVCPFGILRIVAEKACPQSISQWRTAQRKTGMARLRFLNSIERESADRVDAKLIEFFCCVLFLHRRAHVVGFLITARVQISSYQCRVELLLPFESYAVSRMIRHIGLVSSLDRQRHISYVSYSAFHLQSKQDRAAT